MTSPGWFAAIACAVLIVVVIAAMWGLVSAADGMGRNHLAGIRLPSLLRSDEAWKAGHVAAQKVMRPFLFAAAAAIVVSIPAQLAPVIYVALVGLSLVCIVAALVAGTVSASRAAGRVTSAE